MRALVAVAIGLGLIAPVAGAAGKPPGKTIKHTVPSVAFNASTGVASAVGGSYVVNGKKQPVKFAYQYSLGDQAGNTCGAASAGTGRTFALKTAPYSLKARFGLRAPGKSRLLWGKWRVFELGGIDLQCGTLASTTLPPAAQLCAWPDQGQGFVLMSPGTVCGVPPSAGCAWSSPATLVGGVFTVGSVSCQAEPCHYIRETPVNWWSSPTEEASGLNCPDGSSAAIGAFVLRLGHYDSNHQVVIDCQYQVHGVAVLRFTIPPNIGGVLQVDSLLVSSLNHIAPLEERETQTSQFDLGGSQNGCPLNLADISKP